MLPNLTVEINTLTPIVFGIVVVVVSVGGGGGGGCGGGGAGAGGVILAAAVQQNFEPSKSYFCRIFANVLHLLRGNLCKGEVATLQHVSSEWLGQMFV